MRPQSFFCRLASVAALSLFVLAPEAAAQGTWASKAPMPIARAHGESIVVNGMLYDLGSAAPHLGELARLQVYDPATDSWTQKTPVPVPRETTAAGLVDGIIYAAGGWNGSQIFNTVNAYDPATDTWTTKAPMPTARRWAGGGVVNGVFYVVGGDIPFVGPLSTVEGYDPVTDTWSTKSPMPTARFFVRVVVINGILYAIGGLRAGQIFATVEAYDPATNTWTTKAPMLTPRALCGAAVIDGILYAVGGVGTSGFLSSAEAYDPATDTWTTVASMPTARQAPGVAAVNGTLYAVGGYNGTSLSANEAFTLTPTISEAWVSRYAPGPGDAFNYRSVLTVDSQRNVYVAGPSVGVGSLDWTIIKYGPDGTQLWVRTYDGPGHGDDFPSAIAVHSAGHVYVTGSSVGDGTAGDFTTIKYDADGNQLAEARYHFCCPDGPTGVDFALDLAFDSQGNVYVTGGSEHLPGYMTYATIKYNSDLTELWVAREGQFVFAPAVALAVDAQGNVYVTGQRAGPGSWDYFTVKYDASGNKLWEAAYNGPNSGVDVAAGIALDSVGNVYVTGTSEGDSLTIKYSPGGALLWERRYPAASTGSVAVDSDGNVYVSGSLTIKYTSNGDRLWVVHRGGRMALDSLGNAYVTTTGAHPNVDYVTARIDTNGNTAWVASYKGPVNYLDLAHDIAVDWQGNAYVTGYSYGICCVAGTPVEFATVKYANPTPPNTAPVADAGADQTVIIGESVTFDGTGSFDSDGTIASFDWTFGDGGSANGAIVGHVYATAGSFTATLTVTDDDGATSDDTAVITVQTLSQAIQSLSDQVASFNFQQGIAKSLDAKLQNVQDALQAANANDREDASNKLMAFINAVNAQRGKEITDAQADALIAFAMRILAVL